MINKSISKKIPFSYLWIIKRFFGPNTRAVLDLGCGDGKIMKDLSEGEDWEITGVDIHKESVNQAKKIRVYNRLIVADVVDAVRNFIKNRRKFDVVFCSQMLEHLDKSRGEELLRLAEKISLKRVIITTPQGFVRQAKEYIDENPYQKHKSGWSRQDFVSRGYKVYGLGFRLIWSEEGLARDRRSSFSGVAVLISFFMSLIVYYLPKLGAGLLCVKEL